MGWSRDEMAARAAREVAPGMVVNLGIGIPTLVANYIAPGDGVMLHSENGLLGMGPFPYEGDEDPQVINAGKQTVTIVDGGSTFDSTLSFAMIRGGHVDLAILGAMEVAQNGDLANWMVPGGLVTGMGGAMDLVSGARRVIAVSTFRAKDGAPKLVPRCALPLTGVACVQRVVTDVGVFDPAGDDGFRVVELAPGASRADLGDDVPLVG
ncbi:MAG: 3-oxoacid CoA-transferase subunit B [Myxococcales bacterium]|nr:3-oxoacid CoA-transferase subunit B [Myxococcales bacterium]MCB9733515.1 3-oxoacid CoA-transferase subunit B [Deltaproteobacteria bacterium]